MGKIHPDTRISIYIAFFSILLMLALGFSHWTRPHQELFYDRLTRLLWQPLPENQPRQVVVVAIKNGRLFGDWPWPHVRRYHAQVLKNIQRDHPRAVALNFLFLEPADDPDDDRQLLAAIKEIPHLALPVYHDPTHSLTNQDVILQHQIFSNITPFQGNAAVETSTDGVTRQLQPLISQRYPPLSVLLSRLSLGGPIGPFKLDAHQFEWDQLTIPLDDRGLIRLNYQDFDRNYPIISYQKVLQGDIAPGTFTNKIVLIGSIDIVSSGGDFIQTPLAPHSPFFGISFHAQAVENILNGRTLSFVPFGLHVILLGVFGLGAALCFKRISRLLYKLLTLGGLVLGVALLALILFQNRQMIYVFDLTLLIVFTFLVVSGEVIASTNRELRKTNRELAALNITLEEKVQERTAELAHSYTELERLQVLKDQLTHMVVHDLKNPLTSIIGSMELLLTRHAQGLEKNHVRLIDTTYNDSQRLLNMLNNILDITRMEEGQMELQSELVEVGLLIQEISDAFQPMAERDSKNLTIEVPSQKWVIWADRYLLQRVFHNLLSNALKYTDVGDSIVLSVSTVNGRVQVSIQDTGIGIENEYQDLIFEKFAQVDASQRRSKANTGLGLTFCRMVIELHEGRIWVESRKGQGSRFVVELPLVDSDFQDIFEEEVHDESYSNRG